MKYAMSTQSIRTRFLGTETSFSVSGAWLSYWILLLRLTAGWWMLHAGLDKIWAWPFDASWFVGGAAQGTILAPFVTPFSDGILLAFVNVAVPLGQTAIGLGLILGVLTRTAAFFGAFMMLFFYFINGYGGGWANGMVTGELLGIMVFGTIVALGAGGVLAVDNRLREMELFENTRLRKLLG
ncbi:DoxX family protein [Halorussus marinus]|uniref:DoxX family protein n=2 Tax=Halobacteriales TaxID=2235 RepID=UPI001FCEF63D|nr:DoxX family protein [Halorussus marinus]